MTEIASLITQLQKAREPNRLLDELLAPLAGCKPAGCTVAYGTAWKDRDGDYIGAARKYTGSIDAARTLLPWSDHPGAELHVRTVKSSRDFYCFVEFTWPSTERQGRHTSEAIATCICALEAIRETEWQMAPYRAPTVGQSASEPK